MPLGSYKIEFNFDTKGLEEFTAILKGPGDIETHDKAREMIDRFSSGDLRADSKEWRNFVKPFVECVKGPEDNKDYKGELWRDALIVPAAFEIFWRLFRLPRDYQGPTFQGLGGSETRRPGDGEPSEGGAS